MSDSTSQPADQPQPADAQPQAAAPAAPSAAPPPAPPPAGAAAMPPPPPGYSPPPPAAADMLRAQTRSVVARFDPAGTRPTVVVGIVIVALFFGAQLVNAVLPARAGDGGAQPGPGGAVDVGPLRIHLAPGWQQVQTEAGARLAKGSVAIDIQSTAYGGDAAALYRDFVEQVLAPAANGFGATPPSLVNVGGLPGVRGAYTGIFGVGEVEGQLTAFIVGGTGFVFDAWGSPGTLRALLAEIELMMASIEVR